ncbi:hypothetical protein FH972_022183 [Carpinus fangiana]|uniref:FAM192A/Fyv6 N-terminal domain-containing protein n=1 Tax=Carpinus fangiana TaxID=176857 RepID=A0A5N6KS25_9ROSI|nr:hypothetical protein FH972_022183 [Carpinus fangiana]
MPATTPTTQMGTVSSCSGLSRAAKASMSSGFVSAGTGEDPPQRDAEWLAAQKEIEAAQLRKKEEANPNDGKSLYEVGDSQAPRWCNRVLYMGCYRLAAKQEAFEEAAKLKNQFRSLDDDEVDFLDAVLESTREKEATVRKETIEQLELFRKQREEAEKAGRGLKDDAPNEALAEEEQQWTTSGGRKRKKGPEKAGLKGFKMRKSSSSGDSNAIPQAVDSSQTKSQSRSTKNDATPIEPAKTDATSKANPPTSAGLGLAAYPDSDED